MHPYLLRHLQHCADSTIEEEEGEGHEKTKMADSSLAVRQTSEFAVLTLLAKLSPSSLRSLSEILTPESFLSSLQRAACQTNYMVRYNCHGNSSQVRQMAALAIVPLVSASEV